MAIEAGKYHSLKILRKVDFGFYLDDGGEGILLPKRFAPAKLQPRDELRVFVYHDSEDRLIATTEFPKAAVGDIALLTCVAVTPHGAFLDWGLMKDLFVPRSQQLMAMRTGGNYLVYLYIDPQTGRVAATEKIGTVLSNEELSVKEMDIVQLIAYRKTDLGFTMIINNKHTGLLYDDDIFKPVQVGDTMEGFVKTIRPDNKIDLMPGKPGFQKVDDEAARILRLLQQNNGFLPFTDKSDPAAIYDFFEMSKKTFKMTIGNLYKQRKIIFADNGIRLSAG